MNKDVTNRDDPMDSQLPTDPEFDRESMVTGSGGGHLKLAEMNERFVPDTKPGYLRDMLMPEGSSVATVRPDSLTYKSTVDKDFRTANPATAARHAWRGPSHYTSTLSYRLGKALRDSTQEGHIGSLLDLGPWVTGPVGAAAGAVPGFLGGKFLDWRQNTDMWTKPLSVLGALLGLGGGVMAGNLRKSGAAMFMQPPALSAPRQRLMSMLAADPYMPPADKQQLYAILATLPASDAARIFNLLPAGVGAGVGAILAKLLGLGPVGLGSMALLGGLLGGFQGAERDPQGNRVQRLQPGW